MTTKNPTGYCPTCKQRVLLQREEIDTGLAILLLIFTAGIGLIVYIILYYSKPENRCVHCNTEVLSSRNIAKDDGEERISYQDNSNPYLQKQTKSNVRSHYIPVEEASRSSEKPTYCRLCGGKINSEDQRFCSNCGCEL